jgi:hypothetical protein
MWLMLLIRPVRKYFVHGRQGIDPLYRLNDNEGENIYLSAEMAGNI